MSSNVPLSNRVRLAIKTFGCKANSVDTDFLLHAAEEKGFELVSDETLADAYLINSCTVTSHADRDARAQISRFKRLNPKALIGVLGCYAQVAKEELLSLPEVDLVSGTSDKLQILELLRDRLDQKHPGRDHVSKASGFLPVRFQGSRYARATLKIQDGCNFSCSFCIIPTARGRSKSLPPSVILQQVEAAKEAGFHEVILTGIHLAHYGWDLGTDLLTLIKQILQRPGPRLRISTLDPFEISDEFIGLLASNPRLCPHLHIALQSGSNLVLSQMRRIYKAEEFKEVTGKLQKALPQCFIGVDVIVGFPGETQEEFEITQKFLETTHWTKLHVFSYSERRGTKAALSEHKVKSSEISSRSALLRELSEKRYQQFLGAQIGRNCEVILERRSKKSADLWLGHTENYLPTLMKVPTGEEKRIYSGKIVEVRSGRAVVMPALK